MGMKFRGFRLSRETLNRDEDGSYAAVLAEARNLQVELRRRLWWTAFAGRIGALVVETGLGCDGDKYRRSSQPLSGGRDRIRTAQSPGWGGQGRLRAVFPGADERGHSSDQARQAHLNSLRRSGKWIAELVDAIRGNRNLVLNVSTKQLILPVAVVAPCIELERRALASQVLSTGSGLGRVRS
jgi:hypothetical protein